MCSGAKLGPLHYLDKFGHIQAETEMLWGLVTCHAVTQADAGLVGNQVEVKMFASTGWKLMESSGAAARVQHPTDPQQQLTILRVNEFEHGRRSMSVVVRDDSTGELHVFCKVSR